MKKIHLLLLGLTICLFSACHNDIWDAIDGLDSRVTKLEELCKEMNTNITSLQTIVDVLQSNDFITGVVEIKKDGEVIGYTITFGKHDPITIYHGQDGKDGQNGTNGKDGQNGADGKDGSTPVIGVAQDTDGVYYWTLNGEWLLDDNGNKLPVSGKDGQNGTNGSNGQDGTDGKDGQDGEDGKDGANGQDGKDGITPQLKIEDGYWYISYDNGTTWTQLGKATGEDGKDGADGEDGKDGADGEDGKDGQNGADGKDGQDGDSMFQSVTQDENYVYFTLADGTVIKIAKKTTNTNPSNSFHNNREYIDLGLPSGTKWAKENLNGIYCFGGLYSNTLPTDTIYINEKPIQVGDSICGTQYDVVTLEWGEGWQLPTETDFNELLSHCNISSTEDGMRLTSKINGKNIFLPFDVIPNEKLGNTTTTYKWYGYFLTATAYKSQYIQMSRYYDYWNGGYTKSQTWQIKSINSEAFCMVRPVCK